MARQTIADFEPRFSRLEAVYEFLATKSDIARVETDIANVRVDVANVRAYIAAVELRLLRWTVGTMGVGFGLTITILKFT